MGCASSVQGSHREAAVAQATSVNGTTENGPPRKSTSAPKKSAPAPVDEGDTNAELLTLGACPGSIFDHYVIGRTLGAGACT